LAFLLFLGLFRFVFRFEKVFYLIQFLFFAIFFFLIFKEISKFIFNWLLCFFSLFLYFLMVLFEKGEKNLVEEEVTAVPLDWGHAPHQEGALEHQVDGEGVAQGVDQGVSQELQDGEDPEDDPVPQPGRGLLRAAGEDSFEWAEGGVDDAHEGAGDEGVEVHGESEEIEQSQ